MTRKPIRRVTAWILVAALLPGAHWTALAQTPPAAPPQSESILDQIEASDPANLPTAQRLANVPDSMPAPEGIVNPDLSLRVAMNDALEGAGIDVDMGSGQKNPDGSRTFTGVYDDGTIVVTGRFVDGKLELTKEFRPLLYSGDLGETLRIRHRPRTGSAAPPQTSAAPAAPTEEQIQTAIDDTLRQGHQQLLDRAKKVDGPRRVEITETGGFISSTGETFVPFTDYTIAGLLGTRDLYVRQLMTFLDQMSDLRLLSPEARLERIRRMMGFAQLADMWSELAGLASTMGTFDKAEKLARQYAADAETRGDTQLASTLRTIFDKPVNERSALCHQEFLEAVDADPLLAVDDFWDTLADGGDPKEYVDEFNAAVRQSIDQTHAEINRVNGFTTVAELSEFLKPQYLRTRLLGGMLGGPYTRLFEMLNEFASAYTEVKDGQAAITGLKVALFTVVVGGIGFVVAAPFVVAGAVTAAKGIVAGSGLVASGIQLGYDGYVLYGADQELSDARNASGVLGANAIDTLEQQRRRAAAAVAVDTAFVALNAFQLRGVLAEVRAARAGQTAADAGSTAASTAKQPIGVRTGLGDTPPVQRGIQKARELGVPESEIDDALAAANQDIPANTPDQFKGQILYEQSRGAATLTQIGQIDDMVAAARSAGVTQAEIDAMFEAARRVGGIEGFGRQLTTDLLRATLNKQNIVPVIDSVGPAYQRFMQFWRGVPTALWFRTDMVKLAQVVGNLRWMQAGRIVRWTNEQIAILQNILKRPDASRMYAYISDENVYIRLFDDEVLATGSRFLEAPNRAAIAAGAEALPAVSAAAPGAAVKTASGGFGFVPPPGATVLSGEEGWRRLDAQAREAMRRAQETQDAESQQGALRTNGDFNGDGKKDTFTVVPSGSPASGNVSVSARVGEIRAEAAPGSVAGLTAADINGDGYDDVLIFGSGPDGHVGVNVALGNPNLHPGLSFVVRPPATPAIPLPALPTAIAAADLDGDKKAEIAIAVPDATKPGVWTYSAEAIGSGGRPAFTLRSTIDLPVTRSGLAIGPSQTGADPDPDLFISTPSGVMIFENNSTPGSVSFAPKPFVLPGASSGVALADVNADRTPDVLAFDLNAGRMRTFLGNPGGGYAPPLIIDFDAPAPVDRVYLRELDFGRAPDIVVAGNGAQAPLVRTFAGTGTGLFSLEGLFVPESRSLTVVAETPPLDSTRPVAPAVGDSRRGTNAFRPSTRFLLDDEFGAGQAPSTPFAPRPFSGLRFGTAYSPTATDRIFEEAIRTLSEAPIEEESQYELLMRLSLPTGARRGSRLDIGGALARLRDALFIRPDARGLAARSERGAIRGWRRDAPWQGQRPAAAGTDPSGTVVVTSLGVSTGEAFRVHALVSDPEIEIAADAIVVQPLKGVKPETIAKATQAIEAAGGRSATADGYCLEFLKEPPRAGMAYRIAPRDVQRRFEPLRRVAQAANRLRQAGVLKPDSDPGSYFHSITQWAMWAKEQKFDRDSFRRALIEYTRKNVLRGGREWKKEMAQVVEKVVPHRWEQIQRVLAESQ